MPVNFPEDVEDGEVPASVAEPPKQVRGRPFTKENAKKMALSAAKAKKQRKEARMAMLNAMVTQLNLGEELVKAVRENDETKVSILEKAIKLVGLSFDQAEENRIQNLHLDAKTESKVSGNLNITVKGLDGD